jgi:hypothetical protein
MGKPFPKQSAPPWKGRPNGRIPLQQDQCVYWKEIGHWKNKCPCCRGLALEPNKIDAGKKTGWQPEPQILSHLDTWIFDPGQTTSQGHSRLQKGPSKLGTKARKGLPGDKETVNQCPCARAAGCNATIQSLPSVRKITQL